MLSRAGYNGYSAAEIEEAYRHALGTTNFLKKLDLLDSSNVFLRQIYNSLLEGTHVSHNSQDRIKRTAQVVSQKATIELDDYDAQILASQPLLHWELNESSGTVLNDATSNNRDGTANNTPLFGVPGLLKGLSGQTATELRAAQNEYGSIAHSANFNSTRFTAALWVKTTATNIALWDRDDGGSNRYVRIGLDANGKVYATLTFTSGSPATVTYTAGGAINDGQSHFICVTYDQTQVKIYVDWTKYPQAEETRTLASPTLAWNLGRSNAGTLYANAVFARGTLWDRAISETEHLNLYQAGIGDYSEINYEAGHRFRLWLGIRMARKGTDGTYIAWVSLGIFLPSTPSERAEETAVIITADCFDQTKILDDNKLRDRYVVAGGTNYITAIITVAQGAGFDTSSWNLTPTTLTLPALREWPIGIATKLDVINDLLASINYEQIHFDGNGNGVCEPKLLPEQRSPDFEFKTDGDSIILFGLEKNFSLSSVPNYIIRVVAEGDRVTLSAFAENTSFASPTSTARRRNGPEPIYNVDFEVVDAPDQTTLQAITDQDLSDASQVFKEYRLPHIYYPFYTNIDCNQLIHDRLEINDKVISYGWDMPLGPNDFEMTVNMRAAVNVLS